MSWLQLIFDLLYRFWPVRVVFVFQRVIRYRAGKPVSEKGAGIYLFMPVYETLAIVNVMPDVVSLPNQNATSKDGKAVQFAINIEYEIVDATAAQTKAQNAVDNMGDHGRAFMARAIRRRPFDEALHEQRRMEVACERAIARYVKDWGIEIRRVSLTDFAHTKNFSLANI